MSKIEKRLEKWLTTKQFVPLNEVEAVIENYFPDVDKKKGGSHRYLLSHIAMKDEPDFAPNGTMLIPVKGNKVKPVYIRQLAKAIALIEIYNSNNEKDA
jgi:hypothetical protein